MRISRQVKPSNIQKLRSRPDNLSQFIAQLCTAICLFRCMVECVMFPALHCVLCMCMCIYTKYNVQCAVSSVHCTLYSVHCVLCTVHCTLYSVHCVLCTVHCALYSVHSAAGLSVADVSYVQLFPRDSLMVPITLAISQRSGSGGPQLPAQTKCHSLQMSRIAGPAEVRKKTAHTFKVFSRPGEAFLDDQNCSTGLCDCDGFSVLMCECVIL